MLHFNFTLVVADRIAVDGDNTTNLESWNEFLYRMVNETDLVGTWWTATPQRRSTMSPIGPHVDDSVHLVVGTRLAHGFW